MKRVLTTSIYLLGVLIVMGFTVRPIWADPVVMLMPKDPNKELPMITFIAGDLNNEKTTAKISFSNDFGDFSVCLINGTGVRLDGLDIRLMMPQPANITGMDSTGFFVGSGPALITFPGNASQLVFSVAFPNPGTGVPPGAMFTIKLSGFTGKTDADIIPTGVPEPTTILLLGTGLAGVAIKTRKRLKRGKSG